MPRAFEGLQVQVLLAKRQPEGRAGARDQLVEHQHGYETRQQKMEPSDSLAKEDQAT